MIQNPDWKALAHNRRNFLLDLGQELIKPHVKQRMQKLNEIPTNKRTAMKELLFGEDASPLTQHSSSMEPLQGTASVGHCKCVLGKKIGSVR